MLAAYLGQKQRTAALVLLTSRFSFDDAHDAMVLRVAGVIVKPFRTGQHAARLLDLTLRQMNVRARRSSPRFAIPETMSAVLRLSGPDGEDAFPLKNISESGAKIDLDSRSVGSLIEPGKFFPLAALSWGDVQLEAAIDVVHTDARSAGIRFSRIFEGAPRFLRALRERQERAIGPQGIKRQW
jgi:PilZ domain